MQGVQPAPQRRTSDKAFLNYIESYLYVRLGGGRSGDRVHQDWSPFFLSLNWLSTLSAFFHPAEIFEAQISFCYFPEHVELMRKWHSLI